MVSAVEPDIPTCQLVLYNVLKQLSTSSNFFQGYPKKKLFNGMTRKTLDWPWYQKKIFLNIKKILDCLYDCTLGNQMA